MAAASAVSWESMAQFDRKRFVSFDMVEDSIYSEDLSPVERARCVIRRWLGLRTTHSLLSAGSLGQSRQQKVGLAAIRWTPAVQYLVDSFSKVYLTPFPV